MFITLHNVVPSYCICLHLHGSSKTCVVNTFILMYLEKCAKSVFAYKAGHTAAFKTQLKCQCSAAGEAVSNQAMSEYKLRSRID